MNPALEVLPREPLSDAAASRQRERRSRRAGSRSGRRALAIGALSIAAWLAAWQAAATYKLDLGLRFENIPAPTEVAGALRELVHAPRLAAHVASSVRRILIGFAIAAALGVVLGLAIGRFRIAAQSMLPPLEVLRPIPAVAWIPIAILLFASPEHSMVFITAIGAFFPIVLGTIHGVEGVDRRLIDASLTLGARPLDVFREVLVPGALPSIVTGLSIGMGTSWFSLVTAEMISGQLGIGYYTWEAYTLQKYPAIVVGMLAIGILGMVSSLAITRVGRRLMPWFQPDAVAR